MSPMSYSEIIARCIESPAFFLALTVWISFFIGAAFSLGWCFVKRLFEKNKPHH